VSDFEVNAETHPGKLLASYIANVARAEPTIQQRVFRLCESQLSPTKRTLLLKVIAQLGTVDAVIAGLNFIDVAANQPVPHDLWKAIETVFLERRPYGNTGNSYTLVFRSSSETNEIRAKLFEMALRENNRSQSAFILLGQIEVWRLEHGRLSAEPRHPAFDSGELWPPIKAETMLNSRSS
jgi:hypothetical protein